MLTIKFTATYEGMTTTGTVNVDYAHDSLMEIHRKVADKINRAVFSLTISL